MRARGVGGRWPWLLMAVVLVAWAFAIVGGYYGVHKPFGVANLAALGRTAGDVLTWLALLAAAAGLGRRAAGRWLATVTPLEDAVLSLGLGLGLLSLLGLVVAAAGGLHPWLGWLLLAVVLAANLPPLLGLLKRLRSPGLLRAGSGLERLLAGYVAITLILIFLRALAPPYAWDGLAYHLAGPQRYLDQGRIVSGIDIVYLGFPTLVETLYTLAMLLKGPAVATLVHFTYGLLALGAVYALSERHLTRQAGWLGMAVLLSAPTIALLAAWPYVDLALLFYELAAFALLLRALDGDVAPGARTGWLALCGVACGLAMGVKYTAVLLPVVIIAIGLLRGRKEGIRPALRQAVLLGAAAALTAAPWYIKSWVLTGNPVYPFVLSGRFWDEFRASFFGRPGTGLAATAPWRLLIAPLEATILGTEGREGYAATIGPLFLVALPLVALLWKRLPEGQRRFAGLAAAIAAPQFTLWLVGVAWSNQLMQTRLLFPIFGFLAVLCGLALDQARLLDRPTFSVQRLLSWVALLVLGLDLLSAGLAFAADNSLAYLAGWQSREQFLTGHLGPYYQAAEYINTNLPEAARLYSFWEPRSFYLERELQSDGILDQFLHLRYLYGDADGIAAYLRGAGFSHVLLYRHGLDMVVAGKLAPINGQDLAVLDDLIARHLRLVQSWGDMYELYEVRP